jgi:hypothetical protein
MSHCVSGLVYIAAVAPPAPDILVKYIRKYTY